MLLNVLTTSVRSHFSFSPTRERREILFAVPDPSHQAKAEHGQTESQKAVAAEQKVGKATETAEGGKVAQHVREQAAQVMEGTEGTETETEKEPAAVALATSFEEIETGVERAIDRIADVNEAITQTQLMNPEDKAIHLQMNADNFEFLKTQLVYIRKMREVADLLAQWSKGGLSPSRFGMILRDELFRNVPNPEAITQLEQLREEHPEVEHWDSLDPAIRTTLANSINIQPFIETLSAASAIWKRSVEQIDKYSEQFPTRETRALQARREKEMESRHIPIWDSLEFYSINHFVTSIQAVWHSFTEAGHKWSILKQAHLSARIGELVKWLPFGEQAEVEHQQHAESEQDKVMSDYQKFLESNYVSFEQIVSPHHPEHGLLHLNSTDGNRFRGVLKYMSSKGWLYDFDPQTRTVFGYQLSGANRNVPSTWSDSKILEFVQDLERDNGSGQGKAKDNGYARVSNFSDIPPMVTALDQELERHNYWAVLGIAKRAIEKGKLGETSAWLSTRIMRKIRDDATTHKYFPKGLMDALGNLGIVSPAWITTFFKIDRGKLEAYQRNQVSFDKAGTLAGTIHQIEQDIQSVQEESGLPPLNPEQLDRATARVLASQTLQLPRWSRAISIFNSKYTEYRGSFKATSIKPGDTDDDFYNVANGGSEVILMGGVSYRSILSITTTGDLNYPVKGITFIEQLIERYEDLKKTLPGDEFRNFFKETQVKLNLVLTSTWTHAQAPLLAELPYLGGSDKLLMELIKRELISHDAIVEQADKFNHPLAKRLKGQMEKAKMLPTPAPAPTGT